MITSFDPIYFSSLWFHYRFIVITQVGQGALVAVRALIYAYALSMAQQGLMEIIDDTGIPWQQGLQECMGCIGGDLLANQSQASRHAVDMNVDRKYRFLATEQQHAGCRLWTDSFEACQPCSAFSQG